MTFKEQVAADIDNVFLNFDEFGEYQNKNEEAIEKRKNDSTKIEQFFTDKKEILVKDTRLFYDILNGDYDKKIKFSNQKNIMKNKKNEEEEEEGSNVCYFFDIPFRYIWQRN